MSGREGIQISVIVPAYRAGSTLGACIESLLAQRFGGSFEVLVVASGTDEWDLPALPSHSALVCIERPARMAAAVARNLGAELARGDALAFTDADVIASHCWLERLSAASGQCRCVAGSVANGTPQSIPGTVEYLVEFFDLSPSRREPSEHGASCNLFVPRPLWDEFGPFPEQIDGCEDTWLTTRLLAVGRLYFAADAVVHHLNRQRLGHVLAHQYALGGSHARLALAQQAPLRSPTRDAAAATLERIRHLYRSLFRWQAPERQRAVLLAPLLAAGFGAWGAGLMIEARRIGRCP